MNKILLLKCYLYILLEEIYLALEVEKTPADKMIIYCLMRFMSVTREYIIDENKSILSNIILNDKSIDDVEKLIDPIQYHFDNDTVNKMELYCVLFHTNSKKLTEMIRRVYNYSYKELTIKYRKILKMKSMRHSYMDLVHRDYLEYSAKYRREFRTIPKADKEFIAEILIIFDLIKSFIPYCKEINTTNLKTIVTLFNKHIRTYLMEEVMSI